MDLPGVAVLILSIPISQWADSNLPDGIVPVCITYIMSVTVLWSAYLAMQYAFVGIVQTRKGKDSYGKTSKEDNNLPEKDKQKPILLLEAKSIVAESNFFWRPSLLLQSQIRQRWFVIQRWSGKLPRRNQLQTTRLYRKKQITPMSHPLFLSLLPARPISKALMTSIRVRQSVRRKEYRPSMSIYHNYRPEVEWKRFKTRLSSFDIRHLVWSIATRLGLGKGRIYSNDDCACYIERRFASLCVTAGGEPLSHNTLRNLTVTSNSDLIHCDYPGADGLLFHIPLQLGTKDY